MNRSENCQVPQFCDALLALLDGGNYLAIQEMVHDDPDVVDSILVETGERPNPQGLCHRSVECPLRQAFTGFEKDEDGVLGGLSDSDFADPKKREEYRAKATIVGNLLRLLRISAWLADYNRLLRDGVDEKSARNMMSPYGT